MTESLRSDTRRRRRWQPPSLKPTAGSWHGSRILLVGFVSYLISTGFIFAIFGVFIRPVAETFGANMATMGMVPVLYHLMSSCLSPVLGRRFSRHGIRVWMLLGAGLLPAGLLAVSRAVTIGQAAICFAGMAVVGSIMMGPLAANTLVTNWYGPSRGRALGLTSTGSTAAGILLPPLAALLIGLHGWRDALAILAVLGTLVSLPTLFWLAVDRPEQIGQEPEEDPEETRLAASMASVSTPGESVGEVAGRGMADAAPISSRELVGTLHFWAIAAMFGLLFAGSLVSVTFTVAYAEQLGLSLQQGAWILTARSVAAISGQISLGGLSDRIGRRPVLWGAIAAELLCWTVIAYAPNVPAFVVAGIGVGFFGGSFAALRGALVASVFGRRDFPKVSGLLVPAALPFQVMAVPAAGYIFDVTGDYAIAFRSFLFVFPVAALLLLLIPDRAQGPAMRR